MHKRDFVSIYYQCILLYFQQMCVNKYGVYYFFFQINDPNSVYDCINLGRRIDVLWPNEFMRTRGGRSYWRDWLPETGMEGPVSQNWGVCFSCNAMFSLSLRWFIGGFRVIKIQTDGHTWIAPFYSFKSMINTFQLLKAESRIWVRKYRIDCMTDKYKSNINLSRLN